MLISGFGIAGVTIGLVNSSYFVDEGNTLSVCVQLQGTIQRSIAISISTHNGSAISEYQSKCLVTLGTCAAGDRDFSAITDSRHEFHQSQTEQCIEVLTLEDDVHENQEDFTVQISTADDAVILETDVANIFLVDNDGKFRVYNVKAKFEIFQSVDAFPRFMMDTYSVNESVVEISLCILLEMEIERIVSVEVRTEDGTATGND